MKYTLLDIVQNVLSSMDSDEVNSISDTPESEQVVAIIKTVYDDIITRGSIPFNKTPFTLTASNDVLKPVLMSKPDNIVNVDWLKYNKVLLGDTDPQWDHLNFLPFDQFMDYTQGFNPSETDVDTMTHTFNGFDLSFVYRTDTAPNFYTTLDDNTLIFDAYDNTVDSTLQASKTLGYGSRVLQFVEIDSFVPELPSDQFALLINEAKSLAWAELKQVPHQKAEMTARRNWSHLAKSRIHIPTNSTMPGPNFGRVRR
jgi:hypothetical protein